MFGWLEIIVDSDWTFYTQENGKLSFLFVFFILRLPPQVSDVLANLIKNKAKVQSSATLELEDGTACDQKFLTTLGYSPLSPMKGVPGIFDFGTNTGCLLYRIEELTRLHLKKYRLRIQLQGLEHLVEGCQTRGVTVLSKRK